jgi:hypothetical protein
MPTLSNYARIEITTVNVAGFGIGIAVIPSSNLLTTDQFPISNDYISSASTSIPASSAMVFPLPYVQEGDMTVYFNDVANSGKLICQIVTMTLALARLAVIFSISGAFGSMTETLHVPSVPIGLYVDNTDAVAHTVGYFAAIGNP